MMDVKKNLFGRLSDGSRADLFTLINDRGVKARLTAYGAILISLEVPDRDGRSDDVTLGFDSLEGYLDNVPYFGAIIGRCANRIAGGRFVLDGIEYTLARNCGPHHLHGGIRGFDKVLWAAEPVKAADGVGVRFSYLSKDGEEGYPGNVRAVVTYMLTANDELRIAYGAESDKPTPLNLTHHSYFNLAGEASDDVLGHEVMLEADAYTAVDDGFIPTGELRNVEGTAMDFRAPAVLGSRIAAVRGSGFDHNYVLRGGGRAPAVAAKVYEPLTGRGLEISTTEPGVQFYTGNFLDGTIKGKKGKTYQKHSGFCLETQHFPDSPNKPDFPSIILRPGKIYSSLTVHRFFTL